MKITLVTRPVNSPSISLPPQRSITALLAVAVKITMVKKKIENGDSVAKIADDLLEDADVIEKIYDIVKENPEKTREEIWDSLMNDTMIEM